MKPRISYEGEQWRRDGIILRDVDGCRARGVLYVSLLENGKACRARKGRIACEAHMGGSVSECWTGCWSLSKCGEIRGRTASVIWVRLATAETCDAAGS